MSFVLCVLLLPCAWADRLIVNQAHTLSCSSYNTMTQWRNHFTTHRIFLLSDALLMLHVELPLVFIFRPLHCSCQCLKTLRVCEWVCGWFRWEPALLWLNPQKKNTRLARQVSSADSLATWNSSLRWCSLELRVRRKVWFWHPFLVGSQLPAVVAS